MSLAGNLILLARPHQWSKNILCFVPLLAGHRWDDPQAWFAAAGVAILLSLMASALYVLNDVVDRHVDALHPIKRSRPIAAGHVSVGVACAVAALVAAGILIVALLISVDFFLVVSVYAVSSLVYSLWFKKITIVDVVWLSLLYGLRLVGGAVCCGIVLSDWLLSFSFFVMISVASSKRTTELMSAPVESLRRRGYEKTDAAFMQIVGIGTAVASVVILCLYLQSDNVRLLYARPRVLWLAIPVFVTWILRFWMLVMRGRSNADPTIQILRDPTLYLGGLAGLCVFMLARPLT